MFFIFFFLIILNLKNYLKKYIYKLKFNIILRKQEINFYSIHDILIHINISHIKYTFFEKWCNHWLLITSENFDLDCNKIFVVYVISWKLVSKFIRSTEYLWVRRFLLKTDSILAESVISRIVSRLTFV